MKTGRLYSPSKSRRNSSRGKGRRSSSRSKSKPRGHSRRHFESRVRSRSKTLATDPSHAFKQISSKKRSCSRPKRRSYSRSKRRRQSRSRSGKGRHLHTKSDKRYGNRRSEYDNRLSYQRKNSMYADDPPSVPTATKEVPTSEAFDRYIADGDVSDDEAKQNTLKKKLEQMVKPGIGLLGKGRYASERSFC